jgi:muconate cycloisomerase
VVIAAVEAVPLAVSFKETFSFGTTDRTISPNIVVITQSDEGHVGYGEACPLPAFTSETQASVIELIQQRVAPVLAGRDPMNRVSLLHEIAPVLRFAPFTVAALDTALLDLAGRALGVPVHALLGGSFRERVEVLGSIGWNTDAVRMTEIAVEQSKAYRWLKLYAGRGELHADLDRLQAVRDAVGPQIELFVDVNGMWSPSDLIRALPRLDRSESRSSSSHCRSRRSSFNAIWSLSSASTSSPMSRCAPSQMRRTSRRCDRRLCSTSGTPSSAGRQPRCTRGTWPLRMVSG